MQKQRVQYIDRLKGLAMLMVVIDHLSVLSFSVPYDKRMLVSPLLKYIIDVELPLFMFLSGLVVSQLPTCKKVLRMCHRLLVPTAVMGVFLALQVNQSYIEFWKSASKFGYWYLPVLAIMYALLSTFGIGRRRSLLCDVAQAVAIGVLLVLGRRLVAWDNDVLCVLNCSSMWPWFVAGYFCRRSSRLSALLHSRRVALGAVLTLAAAWVGIALWGSVLLRYVSTASTIVVLVHVFAAREGKESLAEQQLARVGRGTLYVYLFHFFPAYWLHLYFVGDWILAGNHYVVGILLALLLALPVTTASLFAGWLIERVKPIKKYVFP